jgi:predicted nucleic-acid-binding protein
MKGLDTNVLVRYLTQDDTKQAKAAEKEIEEARAEGEKLLIQPLVLCELVWVLESAYKIPKPEIVGALERVLRTAQFEIAGKDTVWEAFSAYREGRADFSDYYLGRANTRAGVSTTLTFDKLLKGHPGFRVLIA